MRGKKRVERIIGNLGRIELYLGTFCLEERRKITVSYDWHDGCWELADGDRVLVVIYD